ncbi:hypothetical protein SAMN05421505_106124 [Sinosporangium album]|uniref:DUF6879 domain-containing protein n=1 Tax=Sinosporangium album TaxID=504805 RepID=A0A1G7W060_9ACTN|nr:DUF6879 family protein [Sinosporangium album]SDG65049.1 hypothetical protein SAMN05421505_106124 [Sinosporangium album]
MIQFPLPEDVIERTLTRSEWRLEFQIAQSSTRHAIRKLESRQNYLEPGNPSWEAWIAGYEKRAQALAEANRAEQAGVLRPLEDRGVSFIRVHVLEYPLTPYIRFELDHYRISSELGEQIFLVDRSDIEDIESQESLQDFILFDESRALVEKFSSEGLLLGGALVRDRDYLAWMADLHDSLRKRGTTYEAFRERLTPL